MEAIIVANAPTFEAEPFRGLLTQSELLIAADGGGNALHTVGICPHLIIGDLDSLTLPAAEAFTAAGTTFLRYPTDKDETDLELALLTAVARGATQITVLGALGGRWDQGLANVALLAMPELRGRRVRLLDSSQEAYLARGETAIAGVRGETVSLLPLGGPARAITTRGLRYPLMDAELHFERSRGVSNQISEPPAHVTVGEGQLLVVHLFGA
jgi:thiamine pyrophosphokinase